MCFSHTALLAIVAIWRGGANFGEIIDIQVYISRFKMQHWSCEKSSLRPYTLDIKRKPGSRIHMYKVADPDSVAIQNDGAIFLRSIYSVSTSYSPTRSNYTLTNPPCRCLFIKDSNMLEMVWVRRMLCLRRHSGVLLVRIPAEDRPRRLSNQELHALRARIYDSG